MSIVKVKLWLFQYTGIKSWNFTATCKKQSKKMVSEKDVRKIELMMHTVQKYIRLAIKYIIFRFYLYLINTAEKVKFSINNFLSKCDQIRSFQQICSHLLKKSLIENFIFLAMSSKLKIQRFSHYQTHIKQKLWKDVLSTCVYGRIKTNKS